MKSWDIPSIIIEIKKPIIPGMDIPRKRYIPVTEIWRLIFQEALAFGKEWLSVFAPGHQAVIAAHPDGHHGSKNMHVHIVLNSVRKYAGKQEPWHYKPYLHDIDEECHEMLDRIVEKMKEKQGVTEQLKAENQMLWVGKMNNIIACAEEIVVREVVYV